MVSITIYGAIIAEFIQAVLMTLNKDRTLVRGGEGPLPTSSYIFLLVRYITRVLVLYGASGLVDIESFTILLIVGYILAVYVIAFLLEVIVRSVVIWIAVRTLKNKNKEEGR